MKRQGGRRHTQLRSDPSGGGAAGAGTHQQPENPQAGILGKAGEAPDGVIHFHISNIIEIISGVKGVSIIRLP